MVEMMERFQENEEEQEQLTSYLFFAIGECCYGFSAFDVVEVMMMQRLSDLPEAPAYVAGIMSLREKIIPVISLRRRFCKEEIPYDDRTGIVVTKIEGQQVGFIVDSIEGITEFSEKEIEPSPPVSPDRSIRFVTGVGMKDGKTILLLDPAKIFREDEVKELEEISGES